MDEAERQKLLAELEAKRHEFNSLKSKLDSLNADKEAAFDKRRKISDQIYSISRTLREEKGMRNSLTKQVKDSKDRRLHLNSELKAKVDEMKKLQKEKNAIAGRMGFTMDPSRIKREIDELEMKIETEALPFSVEQRVMKLINEKKKALGAAREVSDVFERIHELGKDLDRLRKKADETHKKVQSKAEESQQHHEGLVESAKEIKDLRAQEEEALKKFVELKEQFNAQNELVKAKFEEMKDIRTKLGEISAEAKQQERKKDAQKIEEKKQDVEEKLKKRLTLTTEDLLIFQAKEQMAERKDEGRRRDGKGQRR